MAKKTSKKTTGKTLKVRSLTSFARRHESIAPGDVVELAEREAVKYVDRGYAEPVGWKLDPKHPALATPAAPDATTDGEESKDASSASDEDADKDADETADEVADEDDSDVESGEDDDAEVADEDDSDVETRSE